MRTRLTWRKQSRKRKKEPKEKNRGAGRATRTDVHNFFPIRDFGMFFPLPTVSLINSSAAAWRQMGLRCHRWRRRHRGRGRENRAIWPSSCKLPGEDFFNRRRERSAVGTLKELLPQLHWTFHREPNFFLILLFDIQHQ